MTRRAGEDDDRGDGDEEGGEGGPGVSGEELICQVNKGDKWREEEESEDNTSNHVTQTVHAKIHSTGADQQTPHTAQQSNIRISVEHFMFHTR